ncbi:MAG: DUF3142 domain-containing protein [Proteobacteria bacterium]|nr:DUF3142 domain-containing protein [Pseudomonadota bacterium]
MKFSSLAASGLFALLLAACSSPSNDAASSAVDTARHDEPVIAAASAASDRPVSANPAVGEGVYIWQRMWLPANVTALADSRGVFDELRVLAAQDQPGEGWIDARVDLPSLQADGRPVRPVIRLDGRLASLDAAMIAGKAQAIVSGWRAAGASVDGVEIDFDCATSRLGDYAKLLTAIKSKLPKGTTLSVTALPAWIGAPALAQVLAQADEAVLQVHAVTDPKHGLFDAKQAGDWIARFAAGTDKPFRVALPAYGSALVVDANGRTIGVESEAGLPVAGARLELFADPSAVAGLVKAIHGKPPANFRGFVWFRMPLAGDRRAWPLATVSAVIQGKPLRADFTPALGDSGNGAFDVSVKNTGNLEAPLPATVAIEGKGCGDADALPGYSVDRAGGKIRFVRQSHASLPATQARPLGWVRCTTLTVADVHVHP